ncbi:Molybdate-binding periplasmic protein precursor [Aliarcobacter thereius]|uniref:Molybdate ABC transporter substrate-binding protein n=2 Tax=Aliarcobacter thereius TaxID=544718 RepID=A0A1C0BA33_9BACT|nr:molybdate ABC transporter substrate-binding protein [Aliarcobacter thereius]OCL88403.1 Molybdate-binding periplasmic protein precursor [Aliarcobacter thereius]OCL91893.1 Molybdate-binding periplasmic protein precursor [Aliarcobacter thereius]OCL95009.1 Molybdate-binding periplasmic protein precursor [Aliarcobacter thereius LMG 24486]OCM00457.1 Molybdate-binding periplasmic protein precursor [Aliarcobacter thereius]QBF15120.1 molybdenum ABC transporter ModABC, periplasmic molybdate-binding p
MKKIVLVFAFLCSSVFAGTINIAVAANVSYAINDLIAEFNKTNPDTKVQVTLGSSGKFTAQIENGAPFDIFMSANMKFPENLYNKKLTVTEPVLYAQGSLAMLSSKKLDLSKGINIVTDKKVIKVAIANPKTAPYGTASVEAFKNAKVYDDIESKLIYAESISQAVTYALTAAEVGFIAKSSLYDEKMSQYKENIDWVSVDPKLYTPIDQGIVILNRAKQNKEARAFYDFILSPKAKKIFVDFGYLVK